MTVASGVNDEVVTNTPDPPGPTVASRAAAAPGDDRLITLTSFWTAPDAHIARIRLTTAGIECYLFDENIVSIDWSLANAVGGVKVKVRRSDAAAAMALLKRTITTVETAAGRQPFDARLNRRCPRCGSIEVYRESAWWRPLVVLFLTIVFSFGFFTIPALPWILWSRRPWKCMTCGNQWSASKSKSPDSK